MIFGTGVKYTALGMSNSPEIGWSERDCGKDRGAKLVWTMGFVDDLFISIRQTWNVIGLTWLPDSANLFSKSPNNADWFEDAGVNWYVFHCNSTEFGEIQRERIRPIRIVGALIRNPEGKKCWCVLRGNRTVWLFYCLRINQTKWAVNRQHFGSLFAWLFFSNKEFLNSFPYSHCVGDLFLLDDPNNLSFIPLTCRIEETIVHVITSNKWLLNEPGDRKWKDSNLVTFKRHAFDLSTTAGFSIIDLSCHFAIVQSTVINWVPAMSSSFVSSFVSLIFIYSRPCSGRRPRLSEVCQMV